MALPLYLVVKDHLTPAVHTRSIIAPDLHPSCAARPPVLGGSRYVTLTDFIFRM